MSSTIPNPFWQLPPAPMPPNDPTWWPLDSRVGWHPAKLDAVSVSGESLGLLILSGSGRKLNEPSGSFGGLVVPGNVAQSPDGSLYLLDARTGNLKRFDPCRGEFQMVPCIGGVGSGLRQVQEPHGIGICSGNLYICDPANGCIHRFSPRGRWLGALSGFGSVHWITFDCKDRLYAVLAGEPSVRIVDREGKPLGTASRPDEVAGNFPKQPISLAAQGNLELSNLCARGASPTVFGPDGRGLATPPPDPPVKFKTSGT